MSRSPSPRPGGWSSPGLNTPYDTGGSTSPFAPNGGSSHNVTWASAQARSAEVKGYPGFTPRNQGFFGKHFRKISTSLPFSYGEKEKLGRGRYQGNKFMQMLNRIGWNLWRLRKSLGLVLLVIVSIIMFYVTRKYKIQPHMTVTDKNSSASHVQTLSFIRRRQQVCHYPRGKPGWRCHGVERSS
jgi:mannan polymerase II complex MNN10 subunit